MSSSKRTMLQQVFQVQFEFRQREKKNEIVNLSTPYKMIGFGGRINQQLSS